MGIVKLMNNPYIWLILSFCTVAAFIFGIYSWFAGKRKKQISYVSTSYRVIQRGKENIPDLKLLYKEERIEDLTISNFAIWNSGNEVIEESSIVASKPLRLYSVEEAARILEVTVLTESDETNKFAVENLKADSAELKFDYMNPHEGVVIQVMHTGTKEGLEIDGKIKGGKIIGTINEELDRSHGEKQKKHLTASMLIAGISIIATSLTILMSEWGIIPQAEMHSQTGAEDMSFISNLLLIVMFAGAVDVAGLGYFAIRDEYHFNVPAELRKWLSIDE